MARKIIITTRQDAANYFEVNYLFWLDVPSARQTFYASAIKTTSAPNATAGETTALQSGAVTELAGKTSFASGTTPAQVAATLVTKFNAAQTALNALNDYSYYGSSWDGTTWILTGN